MIKIIITITLAIFMSFSLFAQSENSPKKDAIDKLMSVKKGMLSVNSITDQMAKDINVKNNDKFRAEMLAEKTKMLSLAFTTFTNDYTKEQLDAIYEECTSNKIDYTDQTNNFFAKWRKIKGTFYKRSKEIYFNYK